MLGRREVIYWLGALLACPERFGGRHDAWVDGSNIAGQSNAVGWSETAATVTSSLRGRSGAKNWTGRAWEYLINGTNNGTLSSNESTWGCEAEFARPWALERSQRLFIVKHAVGGTALADYWAPRLP